MSGDRQTFKDAVTKCLSQDEGVTALQSCVADSFPEFEVYREEDDLVIRHGGRFLVLRRTSADSFRTQIYVSAPSTTAVDLGGGVERDIDGLFDELVEFAEV